jgi:hypothetical protein
MESACCDSLYDEETKSRYSREHQPTIVEACHTTHKWEWIHRGTNDMEKEHLVGRWTQLRAQPTAAAFRMEGWWVGITTTKNSESKDAANGTGKIRYKTTGQMAPKA